MADIQSYSVLLDTSFVIRLLSHIDPLHENALGYYKYFLENRVDMKISTISIAEYCVKGELSELPLATLRVVPFNIDHAVVAGTYARILYDARLKDSLSVDNRLIIPNDTKLFAQATLDNNIKYFISSDSKAIKVLNAISEKNELSFEFIDIHTPPNVKFGILF